MLSHFTCALLGGGDQGFPSLCSFCCLFFFRCNFFPFDLLTWRLDEVCVWFFSFFFFLGYLFCDDGSVFLALFSPYAFCFFIERMASCVGFSMGEIVMFIWLAFSNLFRRHSWIWHLFNLIHVHV